MDTTLGTVFRNVLAGHNLANAGAFAGWSRQRTEQNVKSLALQLQRVVGVVNVGLGCQPSLQHLRAHKQDYLEALEHYVPEKAVTPQKQPAPIAIRELTALIKFVMQRGRAGPRDRALILMLFATGAKPGEIAMLTVADYLSASGAVRAESVMRASITFNRRPRPLLFVQSELIDAIDAYLRERVLLCHGCGKPGAYRGLDPDSRLFLRSNGSVFQGPNERAGLQSLYSRLFHLAGLGANSIYCARRDAVRRLFFLGASVNDIADLVGLSKRSVQRMLGADRRPLLHVMKEIIT